MTILFVANFKGSQTHADPILFFPGSLSRVPSDVLACQYRDNTYAPGRDDE